MRQNLLAVGRSVLFVDKSGIEITGHETGVTHDPLVKGDIRLDAAHLIFPQRPAHAQNRFDSVFAPGDQLGDHRIVINWHFRALIDTAVVSQTESLGQAQPFDFPGTGHEITFRIFRIDAAFDGMARLRNMPLAPWQITTRRYFDLRLDQVDPNDALGHGMLHLQPRVHLEEVEVLLRVEQKLECSRADVAHGAGALFVERFLEAPRHVEVQVFGDAGGRVVHLHERECSIQRRHQKLVEESPAPNLSAALKARLTEAAVAGARAVGYVNAGTMEFIVQGDEFYFLEMNTRLQVEHPVTEEVTGLDLVKAQLHVAGGGALPWTQEQVPQRGASIECRIYAEDPAKGFMPSPGRITRLVLPEGPGVRLECGVAEGVEVTVHYDPLLAKLVTAGSTRDEAIARMSAALEGFVVEGVRTAIPFQQRVMRSAAFQAGTVHTQMVEQGAFA